MAEINYNDNIFVNTLIPAAENAKKNLTDTLNIAYKISYAYGGEIAWDKRKNNLNECINEVEKYLNWLKNIKEGFSSSNEAFKDNLEKISITEIKIRESIVKKV